MMCARIGMVTGQGLASAMRKKFPKWLLVVFASGLLVANTINIASDLAGMADAAQMLFWQAGQEVEEQKAIGRWMLVQRVGATSKEIATRKLDVADPGGQS